jgi:hypothetical protein
MRRIERLFDVYQQAPPELDLDERRPQIEPGVARRSRYSENYTVNVRVGHAYAWSKRWKHTLVAAAARFEVPYRRLWNYAQVRRRQETEETEDAV